MVGINFVIYYFIYFSRHTILTTCIIIQCSFAIAVLESIQQPEISNHIPMVNQPDTNQPGTYNIDHSAIERIEETDNRVDTSDHKKAFADIFNREIPGLNQVNGCPADTPYEPCPFDPCAGCLNKNIMCYTSFCGKCQAIYIDMRTGEASDKFAADC